VSVAGIEVPPALSQGQLPLAAARVLLVLAATQGLPPLGAACGHSPPEGLLLILPRWAAWQELVVLPAVARYLPPTGSAWERPTVRSPAEVHPPPAPHSGARARAARLHVVAYQPAPFLIGGRLAQPILRCLGPGDFTQCWALVPTACVSWWLASPLWVDGWLRPIYGAAPETLRSAGA